MADLKNSPAARDIANVMHPYTNHELHKKNGPMIITKGKGVYVFDDTGKSYIEGMAGLWSTSLGFDNKRLVDAATNQMRQLPYYHMFASKSTNPSIDLAEKLLEMSPMSEGKVFFNNSGSEANDTMVKMVWYYNNALGRPKKKKIITRDKAYHGVTIAAASMTQLPYNHMDFDLPINNFIKTDCPHYYRYGKDGETEEEFATRLANNLEELILREGADTIAAFNAEPVMGAGGVIIPPKTYFEKIQAILKKYDILMVADEVICGFHRTGQLFGCDTYNINPDIISVAKALSSSYLPISANIVDEKIASVISQNSNKIGVFGHGYTYSGHPVAAAVALETLKIYEEDNIADHVNEVAPKLQNGLRALESHPLVGEVRGIGLIAAVELVADKEKRTNFDPKLAIGAKVMAYAQTRGTILRAMPGDAIAFCPPLIITGDEIDKMIGHFIGALGDVSQWLKENNH